MIRLRGSRSHGHVSCLSEEHTLLQRYLIVGHNSKGLELPNIFLDSGEEVLAVFSSEEAAQEFPSLSSVGEGWYVPGVLRGRAGVGAIRLSCAEGHSQKFAPSSQRVSKREAHSPRIHP
jgi:hypothetical protein